MALEGPTTTSARRIQTARFYGKFPGNSGVSGGSPSNSPP